MADIITAKQITKTAGLARLDKGEGESYITQFGPDLNSVLLYADQINEVDVAGIDPLTAFRTIHIEELREDEPPADPVAYNRIKSNIIANFPSNRSDATTPRDLLILQGIFENS